MERKQSENTKRKISSTQKLRHAVYKEALRESELRRLKLQPHEHENIEDDWMKLRSKIASTTMNLVDDIYSMFELQKDVRKNMNHEGEKDIRENSVVSKCLHEEINNFLKNEHDNEKD